MSVAVVLPGPLVQDAGGSTRIQIGPAPSVAEALETLFTRFPRLRLRILTEQGELRPHVNVFVGSRNVRALQGLATPVPDGAELFVLPAVSGG